MPPDSSTDELRALLELLPQEIYDHIYQHVFTAAPAGVLVTHTGYRFPKLLHVDRASRTAYAKSYYNVTTFIITSGSWVCRAWFRALPTDWGASPAFEAEIVGLLRDVYFTTTNRESYQSYPSAHFAFNMGFPGVYRFKIMGTDEVRHAGCLNSAFLTN